LYVLVVGILSILLASRRAQQALGETFDILTRPGSPEGRTAKLTLILVAALVVAVSVSVRYVNRLQKELLDAGTAEPFAWLAGVSVWPSLVLRLVGIIVTLLLVLALVIWLHREASRIEERFGFSPPHPERLARRFWSAVWSGPHLDLAAFDKRGRPVSRPAGGTVEVGTVWQNYLRATRGGEMAGWIASSLFFAVLLLSVAFSVFGKPSFSHRGELVLRLHYILLALNVPLLWIVIFWVGYEIRACARFIAALGEARTVWPDSRLEQEETETGLPRGLLGDYLDFRIIVCATKRIQWLIYLPFVSILFTVLARSDFFDTMNFPLSLVFVTGLALAYALQSAMHLRSRAELARARTLERYGKQLLIRASAKDDTTSADRGVSGPARPPASGEQIKIVMERIRDNREGAFASFAQQPALRALLLPFGGYGGVQLLQYLFKL
jgi:hypothetical protein